MARFISYVLLIGGCLTNQAFAESNAKQAGDKALLFGFDYFSIIEEYKYGIGGKFWQSDSIAYTTSINITQVNTDTTYTNSSNESKQNGIGISFGIEHHFSTQNRLSPYLGTEIGLNQSKSENTSHFPLGSISSKNTTKEQSITLAGMLGAEYRISDEIALSAEYILGLNRYKQETTTLTSTTETKGRSINSAAGMLTLLFYFQ